MLLKMTSFDGIDGRKLMDIYQEGNIENLDYFYPDAADKLSMLPKYESDFLKYIKTEFLAKEGNEYWVLEEENTWVSALRLYQLAADFYYIEALETHPEYRRKGYAARLLSGVVEELQKRGPFRLCDSVGKRNEASIRTHKKCGFEIVSEAATNYLNDQTDDRCYGMQYSFRP